MRIPLATELDSRDGTSNKDERFTNVLAEQDDGANLAVVRPGLATIATASGAGGGLVNFNDALVSVFGTTLGTGDTPSSVSTVIAGFFDFAQSPL